MKWMMLLLMFSDTGLVTGWAVHNFPSQQSCLDYAAKYSAAYGRSVLPNTTIHTARIMCAPQS
jgi:hypothetical protein